MMLEFESGMRPYSKQWTSLIAANGNVQRDWLCQQALTIKMVRTPSIPVSWSPVAVRGAIEDSYV